MRNYIKYHQIYDLSNPCIIHLVKILVSNFKTNQIFSKYLPKIMLAQLLIIPPIIVYEPQQKPYDVSKYVLILLFIKPYSVEIEPS